MKISLDPKRLHHAYGIEGDFLSVFPELASFFENALGESLSGNPDAYVRDTASLSVEDAREVRGFAGMKSVRGGKKIIALSFVEGTRQAQNALLKAIEEPVPETYFFIITPVLETLLPTLRSRLLLVTGTSSGERNELARTFLETPVQKRIALLKPFLEEKNRTGALSFAAALLSEVRGETGKPLPAEKAESLQTLVRAVRDLRLQGASVKAVLEHLALVL